MGCDTKGKIKGYVKHEDICNFIKENWDKNVVDEVSKQIHCPLTECDWKYKINEHSEDDNNWYAVFGFICFDYNVEKRQLYYDYSNLNSFENQEYYMKRGLSDMVECESVSLILGYWGNSVEIIQKIIEHFGGGWIDENDCDDVTYYPIMM